MPYRIVEQWTIPAGGYGRLIVIPESSATKSSLRALGEQLKHDTRFDLNANIGVYTDVRAARMRKYFRALSKEDDHFYAAHLVANYFRNGINGFHQLTIWPKGIDGPQVEVRY